MPRTLKNIRITEVSSVDRGAGEGVKVLLMKRAEPKVETDMLTKEEIEKIAKDASAATLAPVTAENAMLKAEIAILKMSADHKSYHDQLATDDLKKVFRDADDAGRTSIMKAAPIKKAVALSDDPAVQDLAKRAAETAEENAALRKRLDAYDAERAVDSFKKRAVAMGLAEEDGETMRKAYAGDATAQAALDKRFTEITKSAEEIARTAGVFSEFGKAGGGRGGATAYDEAMAKAGEFRKTADGARLSIHQAFDRVITDPANADLAKRIKDEEIAKRRAA